MSKFSTTNPVFRKFRDTKDDLGVVDTNTASYKGIAKKVLFFFLFVLVGAGVGVGLLSTIFAGQEEFGAPYIAILAIAIIGTFVCSIIASFVPKATKVAGTLYCLFEGFLVGSLSYIFGSITEGAVPIALIGTLSVFLVVTALYVTGLVKVTNKFVNFLIILTVSFIVGSLAMWIFVLITGFTIDLGLVILIGSLSLLISIMYLFVDIKNIHMVVENQFPKESEWYAAFGLTFTLIWIYIEILRLAFIILSRVKRK